MARPIVTEGEPQVAHVQVARDVGDVRRVLADFGARDAGAVRPMEVSAAMGMVGRFFGVPERAFPIEPFVSEISQSVLDSITPREARGGYVQGTNVILISELAARPRFRPDAGQRTLVHELVHYINFIGSGGRMVINGPEGRRESEMPEWLSEGITQSFSELMLPSAHAPTYTYNCDVLAAVLIERITGLEPLKAAFRSGDFRAVQEALDRSLGPGTFLALLEKRDAASAYALLYGSAFATRRDRAALDEEGYLSDVRVRGAMKSIELMEDRGFRALADEARSLRGRDDPASRERLEEVAGEIMDIERLEG